MIMLAKVGRRHLKLLAELENANYGEARARQHRPTRSCQGVTGRDGAARTRDHESAGARFGAKV